MLLLDVKLGEEVDVRDNLLVSHLLALRLPVLIFLALLDLNDETVSLTKLHVARGTFKITLSSLLTFRLLS
jgi:hypothetical protein